VAAVKYRKETAQNEKQYTKQYKDNAKSQKTQNRQQKYKTKHKHNGILRNISRVATK